MGCPVIYQCLITNIMLFLLSDMASFSFGENSWQRTDWNYLGWEKRGRNGDGGVGEMGGELEDEAGKVSVEDEEERRLR